MDKKISQLTAATTPLTGAEELAIVQSGVTKKTTIEDVKGYKVYTALLTQSGGDVTLYVGSDSPQPLVIGVTYTITFNNGTGDFTNIGAPNNNVGTSFVATGTTPANWGTPGDVEVSYNTGAPVVIVLENTIGNVWFTYDSAGLYYMYSDNSFTIGKTWGQNVTLNNAPDFCILNIGALNNIEISSSAGDSTLNNTPIEIRVYN